VTATPDAPARAGSSPAEVPARAAGVELIGDLAGSGYKKPPALVRRSDGQTVQLTRLLYLVLEQVDGTRTYAEIADAVSDSFGRQVTAEQVESLVDAQLRPLGLMTHADGTEPEVRKANPLLAVKFKYVVSDPAITRRVTAPFAVLFHPFVLVPLVVAFVVTSGWVLFREGLAAATSDAFSQPGLFLLVFAVTALSAGFHEFGHAAACRYGGATPGAMGAGLYLVWPAFYTEVGDSYRLGRGGRVRVDLGGLYFNAVFGLAMFGLWAVTGWEALLLVIATQVLQMVRQLAPFVRFDGYHILADVTGVPDLYSHIKPTLAGLLPKNWRTPSALTWWARTVVTLWVLLIVPVLLLSLVLMVVAFPRAAATAWASLGNQAHGLSHAWSLGDQQTVGVRLLSMLAIALPVLATVYLLVRVLRRTGTVVRRKTEGRPVHRSLAVLTALALLAGLAWAWWPGDSYRPIRPSDRGTVFDAMPASLASRIPGLAAPTAPEPTLKEGQTGAAQTLWGGSGTPPAKDHRQLALVLVPAGKGSTKSPTWVFPFDKPGAPGPGDNQALAVNTTDGSTVYDVAFALVWADGGSATNQNQAFAFASCTDCTTVAIAFQVVLVLGQADVVVPQNISGAVNYACLQCMTYALAQQLVLSVDRPLSQAGTAAIAAVWAQIQQLAQTIQGVPLDQVQSLLAGYEQQIVDIVHAEAAGQTPTPSPPSDIPTSVGGGGVPSANSSSDQPTSADSAAPSPTASESSSPTDSPSPSDTSSPSDSSTP
jgi:putative peptide zinc metalloprotease protein